MRVHSFEELKQSLRWGRGAGRRKGGEQQVWEGSVRAALCNQLIFMLSVGVCWQTMWHLKVGLLLGGHMKWSRTDQGLKVRRCCKFVGWPKQKFSCASFPSSPQKICGMKHDLTLLSRVNCLLTEDKSIIIRGRSLPSSEATPTLFGGLWVKFLEEM